MTTEQYYWQMVSLKEKKKTLTAMHSMLTELEKDVNNIVRVGARNRNDLLQVQLRKAEVETSILEIDNGLTTTSQLLAQHVGKTGETIDVIVPVELAEGKTVDMPLSLRQDHATALNATPQYQLLAKNVEAQKLQHRMQIGANLPQVAVGALYNYNDFMGKNSNAMMFATVRVPISDWWGGSHKIKKQRLALDDAKEQMQDNGQKLIIRMNNAWSSVETSYKKLQIAHDAIEQADENLRLNRDYYRVGTTKMSDLLFAQEQYQQARDRFTDAYATFQTKILEYRQATGQE
jgi:outer membrane protein TolC